jgi:hypothetical protein
MNWTGDDIIEKNTNCILVLMLIASILTGCNKNEGTSIQEIDISSIKNDRFKMQIQNWEQKNGSYLLQYGDKKDSFYLFLNAANIVQGSKATYFESLTVDVEDNTLNIFYSEKEANQTTGIKNKVLYRIPAAKTINTVRIYKNGQEAHFEMVSVIGK